MDYVQFSTKFRPQLYFPYFRFYCKCYIGIYLIHVYQLSTDRVAIRLDANGYTFASMGSYGLTSSSTLSTGHWTQLTIRITSASQSSSGESFIAINFGGSGTDEDVFTIMSLVSFSTSDVVRFGGFQGQIQDVRIYSPVSSEVIFRTEIILFCVMIDSLMCLFHMSNRSRERESKCMSPNLSFNLLKWNLHPIKLLQ